ncbi:hypothetical protein [Streptomyces nigrescens]|uniref:Uncharacterized protein n=1 Tax=Streptomyces nigrescens TaxID=1920 RepID=A0ABY7IRV4_STRNI|nr:hypothetical protein [Streptomyces libani]WAT94411.1 hypothetical protein STRLI_000008 [Streptomyces libani subsp. libani]WAU01560.1 hypothetical protein STRLI_007936 [Streptomyces libani subsp. libani]
MDLRRQIGSCRLLLLVRFNDQSERGSTLSPRRDVLLVFVASHDVHVRRRLAGPVDLVKGANVGSVVRACAIALDQDYDLSGVAHLVFAVQL